MKAVAPNATSAPASARGAQSLESTARSVAAELHVVDGRFAPLDARVPQSEAEAQNDPAVMLRVQVASMQWRLQDTPDDVPISPDDMAPEMPPPATYVEYDLGDASEDSSPADETR